MNCTKSVTDVLQQLDDSIDYLSVVRMDILTSLCRKVLPPGFWGGKHAWSGSPGDECDRRPVYLTFDDGPHPETTPRLLELLESESVRATFFLVGSQAARHPQLVRAIHDAGHTIGNHTLNHLFLPALSSRKIAHEIDATNEIIREICGEAPQYLRPPFGLMCNTVAGHLHEREMTAVYWTAAPEDWAIPGARRVIRRVLFQLAPGSLIVLHEGPKLKDQTVLAAKEIIYSCKSSNLKLERIAVRA